MKFGVSNTVANLQCLEYQLGSETETEEALLIFGVEQESVQLVVVRHIAAVVIVTQQSHIEQQLYVMLLSLRGDDEVVVWEFPFAGLLFQQHLEIHLQKVHTSLQSEHF